MAALLMYRASQTRQLRTSQRVSTSVAARGGIDAKDGKDTVQRGRTTVEDVVEGGLNTVRDGRSRSACNTVETVVDVGRSTVEAVIQVGRNTVESARQLRQAP